MEKFHIICVDDQPEVLFQLAHDLAEFTDWVKIKICSDAESAQEYLEKLDQDGRYACVILSDQNMPTQNGVDWLQNLAKDRRFHHTKKVMLSQRPTQQVFIDAINLAQVDRFFIKPWDEQELVHEVRVLLTEYIFDTGIDYAPLQQHLDQDTVLKRLRG
ncbi:response regulator [Vibrio algivorus]|uniref:Response regulator n=1 Tax=Vibrio algivorus TaxID=1667024 RepID=A0A557PFR5_9VIBR|nr:response regulator [Vibrio algivorus]TVO39491.1 response regulator [Vibrio algivorus]